MDPSDIWEIVVFFALILLSAAFSAAGTALVSIRKSRLQALVEDGRPSAILAEKVLQQPDKYLASMQAVNTTIAMLGAVIATVLLVRWSGETLTLPGVIAGAVVTWMVFLLFGELIPKALARQDSETATLFLVRPVFWMSTLVFPVIQALIFISKVFLRLIPGFTPQDRNPYVTEEEIKVLVEKGEEMGDLEEDEREMVTAIFDLDRRVVREVMAPRVDVLSVDVDMPMNDLVDALIAGGYSRVPVTDGSPDNVIGVLHAKDLLRYLRHGRKGFNIREVMRAPYFVPENKNAKDLLEEMRDRHVQFAVAVDEYGGTAGIVTLEDLIEEIVGEIRDEYDIEEEDIVVVSPTEALVDGRTPLVELNEELDVNIEDEEYDTVGGFVVGLFDHVPAVGEEAVWQNIRFHVEAMDNNRVKSIRVNVDSPSEEE